jgi:5-methylcytosine-specific restriction endonuclease McrA
MSILDCTPYVVGFNPPILKQCSACNEWLPATLECFYAHKRRRGGLDDCCRECRKAKSKAWRQEHPDYSAEYGKQYYQANTDRHKENVRAYKAEHYDEVLAVKRAHYWRNRDEIRKGRAEKYASDGEFRDETKRRVKAYRKTDAGRAVETRKRAKRESAPGSFTAADIEAIRKAQGGRCYICHKPLGEKWHIDHFIPLALGGTNDPGNLRLACPNCNQSKHAKHPHELGLLL